VVAETGETGLIAFAASFPYSSRPCYRGIGEFSVYVRRDYRGRGTGRAVLAALIEAATARGMHKLTSRVFPENAASRTLLRGLGFEEIAALLHPIGAVILGAMGPGAITAFAVLHRAGNGLLTIAKGTVPLAIFGPVGYGLRSGILGAPARATQAASPLLFGLLMDRMGIGVLAISAGLSLSALFALLMLRARPTAAPAPA
jgi:hypothetical protein